MIVLGILMILVAAALPYVNNFLQNYRVVGDARGITAQLALARMRATSSSSPARLNFNLSANSYQFEVWNSGAWQARGGVINLSNGIEFGYGALTTPAGAQTTIAQTSLIMFNSRGLSIDSTSTGYPIGGNPIGTAAIYINDGKGLYFAITANLVGQPAVWEYNGTAWKQL